MIAQGVLKDYFMQKHIAYAVDTALDRCGDIEREFLSFVNKTEQVQQFAGPIKSTSS